ncbi:hypothetical protein [Streptomyces scabiei]|uniref:hypothetical protein n=1 Tax=Streptomyces scabiei TaxID=1930 RepID=UPI0029B2A440|nr:hypothetical protein [Streptomyces scabiei]MDX2802673.1 hypothetical protein [Streptomyces scabiei]MDX3277232.1 hypothetical protein [Streptomyces scabiei]
MNRQPPATAPPAAARGDMTSAEAFAVAGGELYDDVSVGGLDQAAAEDTIEGMETAAAALYRARPEAADVVLDLVRHLGRARAALGLPPRDDDIEDDVLRAVLGSRPRDGRAPTASPGEREAAPTTARPPRRGLGPGFKGIQVPRPPGDTDGGQCRRGS